MAQKLEFADKTYGAINVLSRDYGLMRVVPEKSATPYPRTSQPIDVDILRNRLAYQQNEPQDNEDTTTKMHVDSIESLPLQKPHSTVDFKQQAKSTEFEKQPSRQITLPPRRSSPSVRSSYNQHLLSIGTPHPSKKIALNPKVLLNRLSKVNKEKKVKMLVPADTWSFIDSKSTLTSSVDSQSKSTCNSETQSFHQRRKLFDMNEFNIAKNGKKLSEIPMGEAYIPWNTDYLSNIADVKAANDISEYLNKHGITISKHNSFIDINGRLRSLSFDSQASPPTTTTEDTIQYSKLSTDRENTCTHTHFS